MTIDEISRGLNNMPPALIEAAIAAKLIPTNPSSLQLQSLIRSSGFMVRIAALRKSLGAKNQLAAQEQHKLTSRRAELYNNLQKCAPENLELKTRIQAELLEIQEQLSR